MVVRWLVPGPFGDACQAFADRCSALDAQFLAPTCLYSEVANALYRLCLAPPPAVALPLETAIALFETVPTLEIILVDKVHRLPGGDIALAPQWMQSLSGNVHDFRFEIYTRAMALSYPSRRGSLFDMAYAALAEQAGTTMWTIDERFYNNARVLGLSYVMHPGRDPLP